MCQQEEVKQEITATLEALCGIAEATQVDNVAVLFNFLMDFLTNCIGLMEVYKNTPETVNLIIEVFVEVAHKQICYLGEVRDFHPFQSKTPTAITTQEMLYFRCNEYYLKYIFMLLLELSKRLFFVCLFFVFFRATPRGIRRFPG